MDFYYLCIYRMVHRSILCSIGPGNFCKPGIFKWTVLSNLRMWSGDCCSCFDSAKGQPADIICGFFLLTSILEYITGFILEKVFHNKWWDYSNKPFNLHGYICLKFSIYWGLACTFIMDVIHPIIYKESP